VRNFGTHFCPLESPLLKTQLTSALEFPRHALADWLSILSDPAVNGVSLPSPVREHVGTGKYKLVKTEHECCVRMQGGLGLWG